MQEVWPLIEARKLLTNMQNNKEVIFSTGYGPSGLPHIGTFGEVLRTTMVRQALKYLAPQVSTKLITVSDDMDGLRKIPDNVPNREMLKLHLGKPLTSIPDPFETHESYGQHMNAELMKFLDYFEFEYEFKSSTVGYKTGEYDKFLLKVLEKYDEIMKIMLPSLREERQKTYSPFLPICPKTGVVLQVDIIALDIAKGTITYKNKEGDLVETVVTGGNCKLQWKPDWGMRWAALGVNYEMYGKDLQPTAVLSAQICKALGGKVPTLYRYELFLDKEGKKISKSKGNGLAIEEWLKYGPKESLAIYMFHNPERAKRLYFDAIPKATDEYLSALKTFTSVNAVNNPIWYINKGKTPAAERHDISFSLLLNLTAVCNAEDKSVLWKFIKKYDPTIVPEKATMLDALTEYAVRYYQDFIKPHKKYKTPTGEDQEALKEIIEVLPTAFIEGEDAIQQLIYDIGKKYGYMKNMKAWFENLYTILLGQTSGPRLGTFIKLCGLNETNELINAALLRY